MSLCTLTMSVEGFYLPIRDNPFVVVFSVRVRLAVKFYGVFELAFGVN